MLGYWTNIWERFSRRPLGLIGGVVFLIFVAIALWAPFLASSKPLAVDWEHKLYFPLFRYLFSSVFFTKKIDIFFNILGVCFPLFLFALLSHKKLRIVLVSAVFLFTAFLFCYFGLWHYYDPSINATLTLEKQKATSKIDQEQDAAELVRPRYSLPSWNFDLSYMNDYARLNLVLERKSIVDQGLKIVTLLASKENTATLHTLFWADEENRKTLIERLSHLIDQGNHEYEVTLKKEMSLRKELFQKGASNNAQLTKEDFLELERLVQKNQHFEELQNRLQFINDKQNWLDTEIKKISFVMMPLIRGYHWEDDVGGDQSLNIQLPFLELSRITRRDLTAALIFGARISLFVGFASCLLALSIGVPLGLLAGFYGARLDILLSRFTEVWEAMPAFFMLLLIVTIMQSKSLFLIIFVIGIFSWISAFRFVRAESFKQREMVYIEACRALGFSDGRIIMRHLLPNSILAVMALLPFDIMSAITREAGLAFLGLGEEQSCSWGVLMDEGRAAFPAESALLWPPAIVLTLLLISIAFVGEALQYAMDPKASD